MYSLITAFHSELCFGIHYVDACSCYIVNTILPHEWKFLFFVVEISVFSFTVCVSCDLFKKAFPIPRSESYYFMLSPQTIIFFLLHVSLNTSEIIFYVCCGVKRSNYSFPYGWPIVWALFIDQFILFHSWALSMLHIG